VKFLSYFGELCDNFITDGTETMTRRTLGARPRFTTVLVWIVVALLAGCSSEPGAGSNNDDPREASPPDSGEGELLDAADVRERDGSVTPDGGRDDAGDGGGEPGTVYALSESPYTTLQGLWAPAELTDAARTAMNSGELAVTDGSRFGEFGIGVQFEAGKSWIEHDELAPNFRRGDTTERRSLLYFWEAADPQMIDEESPIRFEGTTAAPMGSTYRPQSHVIAQVFESQVRSARRISEQSGRPFDFAFIAGDMTDGGQENELEWTTSIMAGGRIDPDSGIDDDPIPGPGNDFTDPFHAIGIGVPWYPAVGNHETLYMGIIPATDTIQQAAVGDQVLDFTDQLPLLRHIDSASNGFRDASTPNADVVTEGTTPADPKRRILDLGQVLSALQASGGEPAGHGIDDNNVFEELGYYGFHPIPGKPIRFIVINTLIEAGVATGGMKRQQLDWIDQELRRAEIAGEMVIVGSHHRASDFGPLSVVSGGELKSLLSSYDNVIMHVAGHGHHNAKKLIRPGGSHDPEQGYWEIMCASTVDFPMQSRILEVVYEGDGFLSVYVTNMEQNAAEGTMAREALDLAVGRKYFSNRSYRDSWEGSLETMNLLLRFKLNAKVTQSIESADWPTRIESEETLEQLDGP
jgi:3',5'-cyclic AMP phosphodiesterase CpdA